MKPLIAYTSPNVETLEGRDVTLMCVVLLGNPPPTITWYKMGERLTNHDDVANGNGHLSIDDVSVDDEGEYTCVASNAGGNATQTIQLDVHGRCFFLTVLLVLLIDKRLH